MRKLFTFFVTIFMTTTLLGNEYVSPVSVTDGTAADWDALPVEYVSSATHVDGCSMDGLKSVKVYCDDVYLNILVEVNLDIITNREWTPFHIFINADNSALTGGYGDEFADADTEWMLETAIYQSGVVAYNPGVFKWWGEVGGSGWLWTDPETPSTQENGWGAVIPEGSLPIGQAQMVDGDLSKVEIQLLKELIPARWNDEFTIGFNIQQNWVSAGILPNAVNSANEIVLANKLKVKANIPPKETQEGLYYYITHNVEPYTVEVSWADKNLVEVYLPTTVVIDGISYAVTGIGHDAFADCSSLTSITIPNSILYIEGAAFSGCSSLTSVSINSNAVVGIGYDSDYNIKDIFGKQVIEYIIGDSVTQVGSYAFSNCASLSSITIGSGVKNIGDYAFNRCSISSVTIPNNVTTIGEFAFSNCASLSSITIGSGVKNIGDCAFNRCSISSVTIPNSVTSIGEEAFSRCSALTSITVESNNNNYDSRENCNAIIETATNTLLAGCQNTIIPNSVTSIGSSAFADCFSLSSITIPNSVTTIGNSAFESCSSLASITIPNSVISIGASAFVSCDSLSSVIIGNGVTSIGSSAFAGCSALSSIIIPNGITNIGNSAFYNCSSLTSITIGSSIKTIADYAFQGCSSLNSITIPNSVTGIGKYAFCDCPSLTSVVIGSGVKTIGEYAFYGCSSLTSINFPIRLTSIGSKAFYNCSSLSSIIIPNRVKNIGEGAFYSCSSLNTVTCLAENPPTLGTYGFYKCDYPTLLVPCESWAAYHDHEQWGTFVNIECLRSEIVETDEVIIESGTTTVTITWPTKENVDTYTIIIKQDGILFGTLNFNADGQLLNIAFAPGRDGNHPAQFATKTTNGLRFTVTGLEESTNYTYDIISKDENNESIETYSGEFKTQSNTPTDVGNLDASTSNVHKLLRNGHLIIVRDGVEHTIMGQEM